MKRIIIVVMVMIFSVSFTTNVVAESKKISESDETQIDTESKERAKLLFMMIYSAYMLGKQDAGNEESEQQQSGTSDIPNVKERNLTSQQKSI